MLCVLCARRGRPVFFLPVTSLGLHHNPCTTTTTPPTTTTAQNTQKKPQKTKKVERLFLIGLRAPDPETRRRFFALYDAAVPPSLFERLQFVIVGQEWASMAQQFWLKHALDLILAILKASARSRGRGACGSSGRGSRSRVA